MRANKLIFKGMKFFTQFDFRQKSFSRYKNVSLVNNNKEICCQ